MKQQTANSKQQTANSKRLLVLSLIINIFFVAFFSFGVYYKRSSIINYFGKFYNAIFNNKTFENDILVFNKSPYQTDVKYLNKNKFEKTIKIAILGNSISLHGIVENLWDHESGMAASDLDHDYVHILVKKISEEKQCGIEYIVIT
jgi:membrane-bound acyltransferase YfiQ involved in biofilm formation